jgi:hypothetical protein
MSSGRRSSVPMKPSPNSLAERPLLAFGAHPDDKQEVGMRTPWASGILALEKRDAFCAPELRRHLGVRRRVRR